MPSLDELGNRICIFGPSSSGKSTLAVAIGRARGLPVVHLDLLRHLPNTDWARRPDDEFAALHAEAISGESWVIEGNYSHLAPPRLTRATGIIVLHAAWPMCLMRYFRRCLFEKARPGQLEGNRDSIKWPMIVWIAWHTPRGRARQARLLGQYRLPRIDLHGMHELRRFYREQQLVRS